MRLERGVVEVGVVEEAVAVYIVGEGCFACYGKRLLMWLNLNWTRSGKSGKSRKSDRRWRKNRK